MKIQRIAGGAKGRSRATAYKDLVFTVATAANPAADITEQTRRSLAQIDTNLAEVGSDKSRIVSATVYVTDINLKDAMDVAWCEWIGPADNWPQRACVQVGLAKDTLVEITIVAVAAD